MNPVQVIEVVKQQEEKFRRLDLANGQVVEFEQECLFARQQLLRNNFTLQAAAGNPNSLQAAILNVAAIGISLNPALAHAYLVPRDGAICLDISFRGLVKIATDSGAIRWAKVELVYASDTFEWMGPATTPVHKANPFASKEARGEMVGGYCIAKLPDGDSMVETMSAEDIYKVRDTSKAWKKSGGPWRDWPEEMAKKTIMKRAAKSWPQTPNRARFDTAVEALHQVEGAAYTIDEHIEFMRLFQSGDDVGFVLFTQARDKSVVTALFNSFAKGETHANKNRVRDLETAGFERLNRWKADLECCIDASDEHGAMELLDGIGEAAANWVTSRLNPEHIHNLKQLRQAA